MLLAHGLVLEALRGVVAVAVPVEIVVAVDEDLLDAAALREDLEPFLRNRLELVREALVRQVARDHHRVDATRLEVFERMAERLRVVLVVKLVAALPEPDVQIAEHAKCEIRLPSRLPPLRSRKQIPTPAQRGKSRRSENLAQKCPAIQRHLNLLDYWINSTNPVGPM